MDPATQDAASEYLHLANQLTNLRAGEMLKREYAEPYDFARPDRIGPYEWQVDFHNAGSHDCERAIIAGNRVGKTRTVSAEVAIHATGRYPSWWRGRVFRRPVEIWVGSETNEASRDIVQAALLGSPDSIGSGWLPRDRIHPKDPSWRQAGIPNVADTIRVKHESGGYSVIQFKTYEQGRAKWQGTQKDLVWFDEEPPEDVFHEGLTRTLDTNRTSSGLVVLSFTPLKGANEVVLHFTGGGSGIYIKNVTWDDAPHIGKEEAERMIASYPEYQRDCRVRGIPMMGTGAIYPIDDSQISCPSFPIPKHFRSIVGLDFGMDHPTAAVWLAYDADHDIVYVTDVYKKKDENAATHAQAIQHRGHRRRIPIAWPHDGHKRDVGSGVQYAEYYRQAQLPMLGISARYDDRKGGAQPTEPVVLEIYERMMTGRFQVFDHLSLWFEEKRMYHRRDGKIFKERDDIMAATNYGVMMKRFANSAEVLAGLSQDRVRIKHNPLRRFGAV